MVEDIGNLEIPPEVLRVIPKATAVQFTALPLLVTGERVVLAVPEAHDPHIIHDLAFLLGKKIEVRTADRDALLDAIRRHYGVTDIDTRRGETPRTEEFQSVKESAAPADREEGAGDGSIVSLVNRMITDAIRMGASDIHVEPYEQAMRIRFRLDGRLHEVMKPPVRHARGMISRLKIMAELDIAEKRRPQDGRIRVREGEHSIDIRVSTLPTDFGEKVVLRILDKSRLQLDLGQLGFEENDLCRVQNALRLPYGMILVTGPTGSGKTTTLYAALNSMNSTETNITTIEDPVEYNLQGINQTHVRGDIGLTFAAALRSILRQDPNVIMVGEIRDAETAEIAVRSALTGHLVFSTLHTNDAPSAITRLADMGVEPFLVASSLKLILAQRLLRRLCDSCKEEVHLSQPDIAALGIGNTRTTVYTGKGCAACHHSGYKGRVAVYEVLSVENALCDMIAAGASIADMRAKARESGFQMLRERAVVRMMRGETSLQEVLRETTT